ncbi:nuclear transport factor 2 family protein [Streptomyces sp. DG2A-72]|uniref:YybH family protein n=1 Tax=Streptomyces sp. DG2A-72 TaxID=3051386 RepID=UPI00265C3669|nr:nuclear transport factor 2 family protein [Streptomyces sp. DG2A-72]MDO0939331.1 nuclear transport factor 2 family protein [Streptomyces sp. DG2A-72]
MTITVDLDLEKPDLTDDTDTQNEIFLQVFNSGDGALFDRLYLEDSVSNFSGEPLTGAARLKFFKDFLAPKPHLEARVTHAYVAGDVALIGVEFTIDGKDADGEPLHIEGTCTDVLRRVEDGRWLMAIDRPVAGSLLPETDGDN